MIAVDSNLLVYAHRKDSPWHEAAYSHIAELSQSPAHWAIPWPCLHEFLAIVTHPRIYNPPTPLARALDQVSAWLEAPTVTVLAESAGYWDELRAVVDAARAAGPQIHDARVAAICLHHGVDELWTADREFSRFVSLSTRNPLIAV